MNLDSKIEMKASERRDPSTNMSALFSHTIKLGTVVGTSEEAKKKSSQHRACQNFLKRLFRAGTTWQELVDIVLNQPSMLEAIVTEKIK